MSAGDPFPVAMLQPLSTSDGHLNAVYDEKPHGLPDSTAEHPLLGTGPEPASFSAVGSPDLQSPIAG